MYRRRFLGLLCEAAVIAPLVFQIRTASASLDKVGVNSETLSAFLDVLIPKDETPSASELNTHTKIIAHGYRIENYIVLLQQGLAWLDRQSVTYFMKPYAALSTREQERVTYLASTQDAPSIVQLFFSLIKNDALFI
jgi:hypothetical protein